MFLFPGRPGIASFLVIVGLAFACGENVAGNGVPGPGPAAGALRSRRQPASEGAGIGLAVLITLPGAGAACMHQRARERSIPGAPFG